MTSNESAGQAPQKVLNGGDSLPEVFRATAARLFRERGYARVTVDDIVRQVGVTKGAFYHYFDSKGTLLYELHDEYVSYAVARVRHVIESESHPAGQLRAYVRELFSQIHEYQEYVQVLFDERRDLPPENVDAVEAKKDMLRKLLEDVIASGIEDGTFRRTDPKLAALAVSGMALWAYQWYRPSGRLTAEEIADTFAELIIQGLQAGRG
jgi:AcrR family transcriptional regulator